MDNIEFYNKLIEYLIKYDICIECKPNALSSNIKNINEYPTGRLFIGLLFNDKALPYHIITTFDTHPNLVSVGYKHLTIEKFFDETIQYIIEHIESLIKIRRINNYFDDIINESNLDDIIRKRKIDNILE